MRTEGEVTNSTQPEAELRMWGAIFVCLVVSTITTLEGEDDIRIGEDKGLCEWEINIFLN